VYLKLKEEINMNLVGGYGAGGCVGDVGGVGGYGRGCGIGGAFTSTGVILVLFILLVIIARTCFL